MATRRQSRRPATTVEARENQLISSAIDLAEKQLRDGTASAQVQKHFLDMGSTRQELEQERLRNENALLRAKIESMASARRVEDLYEEAINAMRKYAGQDYEEYYDED